MRRIFLPVMLLAAANFCRAATGDFFADGLAAADAGDFSGAAACFAGAARQRPSAGAFLDLGVAEWRRGRAGAAMLAWERARWIDPFDPRAAQNLEFARAAAPVAAPELRWHEKISAWLPPAGWVWLAGGSLGLAAGGLAWPGGRRGRRSGARQLAVALGFCVFVFSLAGNAGVLGRADIGLVLEGNAPLRLTPTGGAEVIATLDAGEPGRVAGERGNYFLVRTERGTGWLERGQFDLINPR